MWLAIATHAGTIIDTNRPDQSPGGAQFVAVTSPDGTRLHWLAAQWADPDVADIVMATIWGAASDGHIVNDDPGWGPEYCTTLDGGTVRCAVDGTHVRFTETDGTPLEGGTACWTSAEWADPALAAETMADTCGLAWDLTL